MTEQQWQRIVAEMVARWPNSVIPDTTIAVWYSDVSDLEPEPVLTAMRSFSRDGREFPPTGGMLRGRAVELESNDPDHSKAYALAMEAIRKNSDMPGIDCGPNDKALEWLQERSPAAAEALRLYGVHSFRYEDTSDGTRRAQFRDTYNAVVRARQRDRVYAGLPMPTRGSVGPQPIAGVPGAISPPTESKEPQS